MFTVRTTFSTEFSMQSSLFIASLFPCDSEAGFDEYLHNLKKSHFNATHYCRAWRMMGIEIAEFQSDDGEPAGTAGFPILNQLRSAGLVNAGIIVVRYYGGTKLGKSGLSEAYGTAANLCIDEAETTVIRSMEIILLEYDYPQENLIRSWIRNYDLEIVDSEYGERIRLEIGVSPDLVVSLLTELESAAHLGVSFKMLERRLVQQQ